MNGPLDHRDLDYFPPGEPFRPVALHEAGGRIAFALAAENKVILATRDDPADFPAR